MVIAPLSEACVAMTAGGDASERGEGSDSDDLDLPLSERMPVSNAVSIVASKPSSIVPSKPSSIVPSTPVSIEPLMPLSTTPVSMDPDRLSPPQQVSCALLDDVVARRTCMHYFRRCCLQPLVQTVQASNARPTCRL